MKTNTPTTPDQSPPITNSSRFYCSGCWQRFPEEMLQVVNERIGSGFRCAACARKLIEKETPMSEQKIHLVRPESDNPSAVMHLDPYRLASALAQSGYFSDVRDASQALVKILYGQELGISPISAMTGIYIIAGKLVLSASLLATVIKRSGLYDYQIVELTPEACTLNALKQGKLIGVSTFTMEDAQRAGLLGGKNTETWKRFSRNMLFSRAITNLARWYFADLYGGSPVYSAEEMDIPVDERGDLIHADPIAEPTAAPPPVENHPPSPDLRRAETADILSEETTHPPVCTWPGCGSVITQNQLAVSMRHFNEAFCIDHQRERRREMQSLSEISGRTLDISLPV